MMKKRVFLLGLVFAILFLNLASVLAEPIILTTCQSGLVENGYYAFSDTIIQYGNNPCFDIGNDTIIDCAGFGVINATATPTDTAFKIDTGTINNVTIKNCDLTNSIFDYPVYANNGNGITVENISSLSGTFAFNNGDNSEIKNNLFNILSLVNLGGTKNITIKDNIINCSTDNCHYVRGSFNFLNNRFIIENSGGGSGIIWDFPVSPPYTKFIGNRVTCANATTAGAGSCVDMIGAGTTEFANNIITVPSRCLTMPSWATSIFSDNIFNCNFDSITGGEGMDAIFINATNFTWWNSNFWFYPTSILVKWHTRVKVEDASGNNVSNALVTFKYSNGSIEYSGNTDSNGIFNANISSFRLTNTLGRLAWNYSYEWLTYPTFINASKYGYDNGTIINILDNTLNITITLPFNESGANHLPAITCYSLLPERYHILPNETTLVTFTAVDLENDTIGYAYKCKDGDVMSSFSSNNSFNCAYTSEGEFTVSLYANDTQHTDWTTYTFQMISTVDALDLIDCYGREPCVSLPIPLVDTKDINKGLLPTIYFGMLAFFGSSIAPLVALGIVIVIVLLMGTLGTVILKVFKMASEGG